MPIGSLTKRFRRSHGKDRASQDSALSPSSSSLPTHSAPDVPPPEVHAPPDPADGAKEIAPMSMPTPMLVTPQAPEIVVDGPAEVLAAASGTETSVPAPPEEPFEELSLLGHEIEQHYNKPRVMVKSEGHVEELANIHVDPTLKHIDIKEAIEYGVDRFSDSIPMLRKALSDIAKIHPVVTVAVLAFEAVIELEMTRRENDRRVTVLFVEMKAVMSVITHFKDLSSNDIGRDGRTLHDRLRELAESTAEDIKQCANLCDAFLKSRLLVRVLKGPLWAERFASSMERFARRKEEYSLALAMHTASTVTKMALDVESINLKMRLMHELFEKYMSTSERNLALQVEEQGGAARVRHDDGVLRKLMSAAGINEPAPGPGGGAPEDRNKGAKPEAALVGGKGAQVKGPDGGPRPGRSFGLDDLKRELREDLDDTIERNFAVFLRKYDFQAQIMSDRVVRAVEAAVGGGTHARIKNADLQRLWKEMNWTGVVKGRILVHALREHYSQEDGAPPAADVPESPMSDKWALDYLNVAWLHPIMEAIDDDTSGYISVSEVNRFMQRLPHDLGWSLPHWLAYWAIGWRCSTTMYLNEIQSLMHDFHVALPSVLAINRPPVDAYLKLTPAWTLLAGFDRYEDSYLFDRFKRYVDMEEERIKTNLEKFNYRIDAPDTLKLVIGSSRIERCIAPLFCLIMRNDLRKLKAAKSLILDKDEFGSSTTTVSIIDQALWSRTAEIRETFIQRKLDPNAELQRFASGLLTYFTRENTISGEWWLDAGTGLDVSFATSTWKNTGPYKEELDTTGITILPELPLDTAVYDAVESETEEDLTAHPALKAIIGCWNGFLYEPGLYPTRPMTTLFFHVVPPSAEPENEDSDLLRFKGEGTDYERSEYIVNGTCTVTDDGIDVEWCMEYDGDVVLYFVGRILDEFTISGNQRYDKDFQGDAYLILKKTPADYLCFRPAPFLLSPYELQSPRHPADFTPSDVTPSDRARALWWYALDAARHNVQRKWWTWSYFAERRRIRKLWLEKRTVAAGVMSDYDLRDIHQLTTPADARLYDSMTEHIDRMLAPYDNWVCDAPGCGKPLRLTVVICLQCLSDNYRSAVAFCDDPNCYTSEREGLGSASSGLPHRSTHDMAKCRSLVLIPYLPSLKDRALECLDAARAVLRIADANRSRASLTADPPPDAQEESHNGESSQDRQEPSADQANGDAADEGAAEAESPSPAHSQHELLQVEGGEKPEPDTTEHQAALVVPQDEGARSRWSLRSILSGASLAGHWGRRTEANAPSAADASSTLAPSHSADVEPPNRDAQVAASTPPIAEPASAKEGDLPGDHTVVDVVLEVVHVDTEGPDLAIVPTSAPHSEHQEDDEAVASGSAVDGDTASDAASVYTTAPPSIVSSRQSAASSWFFPAYPPRPIACQVCSEPVHMGCWYCTECREFICPSCDANRLIRCVACEKPFPQPEWYYGQGPLDDFHCDVCSAFGRLPVRLPGHVHTHAVVLVRPAAPDSSPDARSDRTERGGGGGDADRPSIDERLAAMEGQIGGVSTQLERLDALQGQVAAVDARLGQFDELRSQVAEIRDMMAQLLEHQQRQGPAKAEGRA